jgi:haloalkane dehalogenase
MELLRTPDDRFDGLPGYPFAPNWAEVSTPDDPDAPMIRVHYLDEGPADGTPILLLHGEPSWSYLYRTMIPGLVAAGYRCIAPDQVGFGKSDKPTATDDYTFARHVEWMRQLICEHLDLRGAAFFGQDWGGLVGLRLVAEHQDRFDRIVVGNTGLPTGHGMSEAFDQWRTFSQTVDVLPIGMILQGATTTELPDEVVAAYEAPFPDETYKAGARIWPALVPVTPDDPAVPANLAAWEVLRSWEKPLLTTFSDQDPVTGGGHRIFEREVPGAASQPHVIIEGGGHFLQEDRGPEIVRVMVDWMSG